MTRRFLVFLLCTLAPAALLAQGKNMGPASQYYKQAKPGKNSKFKFFTPPKKGGEAQWQADHQTFEKEEYVILEGHVIFTYEDMKFTNDKMTMVKKSGRQARATPSDLSGDGKSFTVQFNSQ